MSLQLEIPDSVTQTQRLPRPEQQQRLPSEPALSRYTQSIISFGKAREIATSEEMLQLSSNYHHRHTTYLPKRPKSSTPCAFPTARSLLPAGPLSFLFVISSC